MTYFKDHHVSSSSTISLATNSYKTASPIHFSCMSSDKKKLRSRKKSNYKHVPHCLKPAHLVAKRNARERLRVQAVKSAFVRLSKHVPTDTCHKKLSKLKTLRLAISYIQNLQELIKQHDQLLTGNNYSTGIIEIINGQKNAVLVSARSSKACENFDLCHHEDSNSVTNVNSMNEMYRKSTHCDSDAFHLTKGSNENHECIFFKEVDVRRSFSLEQSFIKNNFNDYMSSRQIGYNACAIARVADSKVGDRSQVISSVFETYVGEIHCMLGKKMTTKCLLNEHSQQAKNNCVLSSCTPCKNMTNESHHFHI